MKILKIISGLIIPVMSLLIGIGKWSYQFFFNTKILDNNDLLFLLFTIGVVPFVSSIIALLLTKQSLEIVKEELKDNNFKFLEEIKLTTLDIISQPNYVKRLEMHPSSRILSSFLPDLIKNLDYKLNELSLGHLFEYDPNKYHDFVKSIFNYAQKSIIATSIVDPEFFWRHPKSLEYLIHIRALIKSRSGLYFRRYFFMEKDKKDFYLNVIANNLKVGVDVYVIYENDFNSYTQEYILKDGGMVDDLIAIKSEVDKVSRNITKVDSWIGNKERLEEAKAWTISLDAYKKSVEDVYGIQKDAFIKNHSDLNI